MNDSNSFGPVSSLPFFSEILEIVVLVQLESHLSRNNLLEFYQSAYRQNHSTETLLLSVKVFFATLTTSLPHILLFGLMCCFWYNWSWNFAQKVITLTWYQWHCVQMVHILSYQQNTVCFCGRHKLFVFALGIWCSPGLCSWTHFFLPCALHSFLIKLESTISIARNLQMI